MDFKFFPHRTKYKPQGGKELRFAAKVVPGNLFLLLVSGSWVGWLMNELNSMLPSRFRYEYLENMPENEAVEVVYKFSRYFDVPITEETAYLMVKLAEGSPFYISSIIRSSLRNKDLTTVKGLTDTLEFENLKKRYNSLQGKYNYQNGYFAEYLILDQLKYRAREKNDLLKSITRYLPGDFDFCDYSRVWRYDSSPEYARGFSVDIFARAQSPDDYSIFGEVKSREVKKFSKDEAVHFPGKFEAIKKMENLERVIGFNFSRSGFTKEAEIYCQEKGIACSEDERWLEG